MRILLKAIAAILGVALLAGAEALIAFLKHPAATVPGAKMPARDGVIEESEYAPLAGYLRTLAAAAR